MTLFLTACGGEDSFTVYFTDGVSNLDPQFATTSSEKNVLYNLFDGLFYLDEWGEAQPDAVDSYSVDGNRYTFTLRDDIFWQDESAVTAYDFEYGILRLFDGSDGAMMFSNIKGAFEYIEGTGSKNDIAVKAIDDKTLVIELEAADPAFLELLADPYAYPCNEEFFLSTKGRYGLYEEDMLTNGNYTLSQFGKSKLTLTSRVQSGDIEIYLNRDDGVLAVEEGDCDIAYISGVDIESDHNLQTVESGVSMIIFNTNNEEFGIKEVREGFIGALDLSEVEEDVVGYETPEMFSLIPNSVTIEGGYYKESDYLDEPSYLGGLGGDIITSALVENFSKNTLSAFDISVKTEADEAVLSAVMQQWQRDLNAFGSLKVYDEASFNRMVASDDFDIAVITIETQNGKPEDILNIFKDGYRGYEFYSDEQFNALLERAIKSGEKADFIAAEQYLIDNFVAYPISFNEKSLLLSNSVDEVLYTPGFRYIDFSSIKK